MTAADPAPPASPAGTRTFAFRLPAITHALLLPFGVFGPPSVTLDDHQFAVRFGFFGITVKLADVQRFEISGPFWWWRALAVRHTLFKTDVSYCTDGRGAVRLYLKSQRPSYWARHVDQVYVGIEDLEGLADELRRRGIPGEDKRAIRAPASPA